jgi:hypothetical protein
MGKSPVVHDVAITFVTYLSKNDEQTIYDLDSEFAMGLLEIIFTNFKKVFEHFDHQNKQVLDTYL